MTYKIHVCGDNGTCPHDPKFIHRFYFGCVPGDFRDDRGTSKTYRQTERADGKWRWNGGCHAYEDAAKEAR